MYCKSTFVFKDGNPHESGFLEDNGNWDGTQNLGCYWQKIVRLLGNCMILGFLDCIKYSLILTLNQMIATSRIMASKWIACINRYCLLENVVEFRTALQHHKVKTWRQSPDQTLKRVLFSFGAQEHTFQHQVETINAKRNGVHWKTMSQIGPTKSVALSRFEWTSQRLDHHFSVRLFKTLILAERNWMRQNCDTGGFEAT